MEQTARLDNEKRHVRICLDDGGNVTVEEYVRKGEKIVHGKIAHEDGWYMLWRHVVDIDTASLHNFRKE